MDRDVPPPWTPLTRSGHVIGCWNRTYRFDGAFPSAIHGRERDLLAAPVRLVATIDGKPCVLSQNQVTFAAERGDRIDFTATGQLGPMKLMATNWIEFDGMVQIKFDLDPGHGANVRGDGFWRFPFPRRWRNTTFSATATGAAGRSARVGAQPGWKFATQFWPLCWVGDDDRGLSFVAEEGHHWVEPPGGKRHELLRTADGFLWKVHLIGRPTHLRKVSHYLIGFQATPMKPMRKDMAAFNCFMGIWSAVPSYYGRGALEHLAQLPPDVLSRHGEGRSGAEADGDQLGKHV